MSTPTIAAVETIESVEEFQARAQVWIERHLPRSGGVKAEAPGDDDHVWQRARELQQLLFDGGFAGICFPREYGGLGLTAAHQKAFNKVADGYEMPTVLNVPSFAICGATLLDLGTEEQKQAWLPRLISGQDVWCQFLSEPRGGSDLAGVTTKAERVDGGWRITGSKIWSTAAYSADFGLCLTRSNWDVPKHQGLTMFAMPTNAPGVTIRRITLVDGSTEFCEAFFDDVQLPDDAVIGRVDDGWTTAGKQLFHERNSMGGGSPYVSGARFRRAHRNTDLVDIARRTGREHDPQVRDQIAQVRIMELVAAELVGRVGSAIRRGAVTPQASSILRLFAAEKNWVEYDAGVRVAGAAAVSGRAIDDPGIGTTGLRYLSRQAGSLGGGSTEIARNIISERVLGMPREYAADRDVPFRDVKQGRS